MKLSKKLLLISIICISFLSQAGCWDQKMYENIGFILQMGIETDVNGNLVLSVTSPVVSPDAEEKSEFLTTNAERLIRSSRERLRDTSGRMLQGGKIQLLHFSKEIAEKKGINEFLDIFFRDPENPLLANIVIVDGSPREMMQISQSYKDKPRPAIYINNLLLDTRRRGRAPESRIYDFSILSHSKSIDPVAPIIRYDNEKIEATGTALFNGDRMVGQIDTRQTVLLIALLGRKNGIEYTYNRPLPGDKQEMITQGASLFFRNIKRKISINVSGSEPVININMQMKTILDEYNWTDNLDKNEKEKKLEQTISNSVRSECKQLLSYLQGIGSDPLGFGEIVRVKNNKYWKKVNWKDAYKSAKINVNVKVNIESYGTLG